MTDKKQKIIDAAIVLFVKNGIHATSMQTLAKSAGVATGSIYTYFDSKDTLVVEIFHAIVEESIAETTKNYDPTQSVPARFYHLLEQIIRFDLNQPHKFRFKAMSAYEPSIMKAVQGDTCDKSPLAAVLIDAKAENLIKDLSIQDLFYAIFGGISSLLEWRLFNDKTVSDTDIANMIDMAWDSIKKHN